MLDRRLPTRWDGRTIRWGEWSQMPRSLCGKLPNGCEVCGTPAQPQTILGQVQGSNLLLSLLRCGNCGSTTVFDGTLFWELDEDDYLPDGSSGVMSETYRTDMEVTARVDVSLGHGTTLTISGMGEDKELWFENAAAAWGYWKHLQEDMRAKIRQVHSRMFD